MSLIIALLILLLYSNLKSVENVTNKLGDLKQILETNLALLKNNSSNLICSGLLLTQHWMLTAAHCVTGGDREYDSLEINIDKVKTEIEKIVFSHSDSLHLKSASNIHIPKDWKDKVNSFGKSDIALVMLKENIPTVKTLSRSLFTPSSSSAKQSCIMIGNQVKNSMEDPQKVNYNAEGKDIIVQQQCLGVKQISRLPVVEKRFIDWFCQADNTPFNDDFAHTAALLFCKNNSSKQSLVGIAAGKVKIIETASGKGSVTDPLIFTSLCSHLSWINSIVGDTVPKSPKHCELLVSSKDSKRFSFVLFLFSLLCAYSFS